MEGLKEILKSPPVLRQIEYDSGRSVIVTVDTSPSVVGWAVGQDDTDGKRFVIRFGARILTEQKRAYLQVKRELLGALIAIKGERNNLIGANVVLETNCLPLLGMIANCSILDIAMLRWIAYIKSLNPILVHIIGKKNFVADMLLRARYMHQEEMETHEVDEDNEDDDYGYVLATKGANIDGETLPFKADQYEGKLRNIGIYLSTLKRQEG